MFAILEKKVQNFKICSNFLYIFSEKWLELYNIFTFKKNVFKKNWNLKIVHNFQEVLKKSINISKLPLLSVLDGSR